MRIEIFNPKPSRRKWESERERVNNMYDQRKVWRCLKVWRWIEKYIAIFWINLNRRIAHVINRITTISTDTQTYLLWYHTCYGISLKSNILELHIPYLRYSGVKLKRVLIYWNWTYLLLGRFESNLNQKIAKQLGMAVLAVRWNQAEMKIYYCFITQNLYLVTAYKTGGGDIGRAIH